MDLIESFEKLKLSETDSYEIQVLRKDLDIISNQIITLIKTYDTIPSVLCIMAECSNELCHDYHYGSVSIEWLKIEGYEYFYKKIKSFLSEIIIRKLFIEIVSMYDI